MSWVKQSGVTVTTSSATGPDGNMSASLVTGNGSVGLYKTGASVSPTELNTKSVWLRAVSGTETVLLKDAAQTVGTLSCDLSETWQRFNLTETQSGGSAGLWVDDIPASGIYMFGAQIEESNAPSSYIPTYAGTETRDAETFVIPTANLSEVVNTTAFSVHLKGSMDFEDTDQGSSSAGQGGESVVWSWWSSTSDYAETVLTTTAGTDSGRFQYPQENAGTRDFVILAPDYFTKGLNVSFNTASRHGSTFVNGAEGGTALTANTTPTVLPDLSGGSFYLAYKGIHNIEKGSLWGSDIGDIGIEEVTS